MSSFPQLRLRRLRQTEALRNMVRETTLQPDDLIYPLFTVPGSGIKKEIPSMPGQFHLSADMLVTEVEALVDIGIPAIILFGLPEVKDELGSAAYAPDGVVQKAIREIKKAVPALIVITDVCLCQYTTHGHCGIVSDGCIDNDASLDLIARTALSHADAGADVVAPSDMMDGRIRAVRTTLDGNGFLTVPILAYAAKYASAFYGPFREAADSAPLFGDRRSYQMDPANAREALREVELDIAEGADIVMVKPALAYLDIIRTVRDAFRCPVAAYSVSGEYSMIKAAAQNGWLDEKQTALEVTTAMKRAGADLIVTYFAKDIARWLRQGPSATT